MKVTFQYINHDDDDDDGKPVRIVVVPAMIQIGHLRFLIQNK
jgi:hypothetical protein